MTDAPVDAQVVVLGAAGDLAVRHLVPAVARLAEHPVAPLRLRVVGVDVAPWTTQQYRLRARDVLQRASPRPSPLVVDEVVGRLDMVSADITRPGDVASLLAPLLGGRATVFYVALPPSLHLAALAAVGAVGPPPGSRIVFEKPFGHDGPSAARLTGAATRVVPERALYRVDHFLHHPISDRLVGLRHGPVALEPVWDRHHVESIEITWDETGLVGARAASYDTVGALRDMVQGHLLLLLALVTMELPAATDDASWRAARLEALRVLPTPGPAEVAGGTRRGRYAAGTGPGAARGYTEEPGVRPTRETETFVEVATTLRSARWRGVPVVLRAGKAMQTDVRRIRLRLAPTVPGAPAVVDVMPDRVLLDGVPWDGSVPADHLPPTARMLRDVVLGRSRHAVTDDEVGECWRVVDAIRSGWRRGSPALLEHPAGTSPP
ncbi:hypothetical protein [Nocardioides aurantiacus]|uniref:Glucose-6-phosphate 1-dehydrogenase n=1 Tax=Nocardioides aurantiacus TaxID=86796 RepID=A0A3N2CRL8_9ACTN|nr:hypothetical protein [Nocardioides aurantiacus]ROR90171.1 glucose-6-phosphate 1-dehydrogenase [Nocardioides aurantiacus]